MQKKSPHQDSKFDKKNGAHAKTLVKLYITQSLIHRKSDNLTNLDFKFEKYAQYKTYWCKQI